MSTERDYWESAIFRIKAGSFLLFNALVITYLDMFTPYVANSSLVNGLLTAGTAMVTAGLIKKFAKTNHEKEENYQGEK